MELADIVADFAAGMMEADARRPQAVNQRSGVPYQVGLGPHTEANTVSLVFDEMEKDQPDRYTDVWSTGVKYGTGSRQKCDVCLGADTGLEWAIEVKMIRMLGDNGKPNDNLPTHILSPYPRHRSALTDCTKLAESDLGRRKAILMYGYESDEWPLEPLISAFEALASRVVILGDRFEQPFTGLMHPIHRDGSVVAWEIER
jgi:hypothetical protein